MKRPAFQFYTGDWQKNAKLRRCSPAARGVWVDVLCLMHDSEEYGVLRWPLKDIANAAGASLPLVRELVAKGVLKGAERDAEPYVYRPKHAGKLGDPVILVVPEDGPVWYSSRFVRDEWVRQKRGEGTRFDSANQPDSRSPKGGIGEPLGDGPSSSSSPSGSEANASGAAVAPPAVDKSTPKTEQPVTPKRQALNICGAWLMANGLAEVTARDVMGKVLKDFPAVAVEALATAPKQTETPNPQAWLFGVAQRLAEERSKAAASNHPTPSAEATAAAEALRRAEFEASHADPAGQAAVAAARERLAATRERIDGPAVTA